MKIRALAESRAQVSEPGLPGLLTETLATGRFRCMAEAADPHGRNALDPEVWRDAGWTYRALGRP